MKLYLAGPEVFLPDAAIIGQRKRELCARHGLVGLFPLDNEISPAPNVRLSKAIFDANVEMIVAADAVGRTPSERGYAGPAHGYS